MMIHIEDTKMTKPNIKLFKSLQPCLNVFVHFYLSSFVMWLYVCASRL